jgi:hypothetical protein
LPLTVARDPAQQPKCARWKTQFGRECPSQMGTGLHLLTVEGQFCSVRGGSLQTKEI